VDFWRMLRELYLERERIDKAILTLEAFQRLATKTARKTAKKAKKKRVQTANAKS
jgi:hypothetical protein